MAGGIRAMVGALAHRPLQMGNAQKYLWNIALGFDGCIQKLDEGIHGRLILDADGTLLAAISSDRLVLRGLTESEESFRARLQRSIDDQQRAGNPWAVLSQVLGYLLSSTPAARTVSSSYSSSGVLLKSLWNSYSAGASLSKPPQHLHEEPGSWDWDSASPSTGSWGWWRWYLVIDAVAPSAWVAPDGAWGSGGTWGDGGAWGVDATSFVGKSIKLIVQQWKAGIFHWCIVSFDDTEFVPSATVLPDGNYGRWSKIVNGVYVRARSSNARYFEGEQS
jgi:hypothetical protein